MTASPPPSRRLNSWKEIASFFGRGERTVKRWEVERGLPVHRLPGKGGARIYADAHELTSWMQSEAMAPVEVAAPPPSGRRRRTISITLCAILGVLGVLAAAATQWKPHDPIAVHARGSRDPAAVELYREGQHDWNTRTAAGLTRATDEFTQAIVRDPKYAEAYVGLANTYILLREYTALPDAEAYPRAEAAARQATGLAPDLAQAHSALAFVDYYWRWDAAGAEREFATALKLDARDPLIHHWYANVLKERRRLGEALVQIDIGQGLDPNSSAILADKGSILLAIGRVAEGRKILERMAQVDPGFVSPHIYLADAALQSRDYVDYLSETARVTTLRGDASGKQVLDAAAAGWRSAGGPGLLAAMLKSQQDLYARGEVSAYQLARTYAAMGDLKQCRAWLEVAISRHDPAVLATMVDPVMSQLVDDPDFAFVRDIGRAGSQS